MARHTTAAARFRWSLYPNKLKEFDLTRPEVIEKLQERYGSRIPEDEEVISPVSIYKSELLETVYKN